MEYGKPYLITDADFSADNYAQTDDNNEYSFSKTNIWNSSLNTAEPFSDLSVLHSDLQEIKVLIGDIKDFIKDFFSEE